MFISVLSPPSVKITQARQGKRMAKSYIMLTCCTCSSVIGTGQIRGAKEGEQIKLVCEAEGNPLQFSYNWSVDDHSVNGKRNTLGNFGDI